MYLFSSNRIGDEIWRDVGPSRSELKLIFASAKLFQCSGDSG